MQLVGKRRLLTDNRAIGRRKILIGVKDACDGAQVDRELSDRFARDHPAAAGGGEDGRQERDGDISYTAAREQHLDVKLPRVSLARKSQNEDHRDDRLHADRDRPSPEPGDEAADKADDSDHEESGDRPRQRQLHRDCRQHRQREAEDQRAHLLAPGRRKIGDAGRYGAQRRRLAGHEAEHHRGDESDRNDAQANAHAVDDVLADEKPR